MSWETDRQRQFLQPFDSAIPYPHHQEVKRLPLYTGFGVRTRQCDILLCNCSVFLRCDTWRPGGESQNTTALVWEHVRTDSLRLWSKRNVSCSWLWRVWVFRYQEPITFRVSYARTLQTSGKGCGRVGGIGWGCWLSIVCWQALEITTCSFHKTMSFIHRT